MNKIETTRYVVKNTATGKSTEIDIPSRYDNITEVINLVLSGKPSKLKTKKKKGNRKLDKMLQKKMIPSMKEYGQLCPGIVQPNGDLSEGQHRENSAEKNNMNFEFIVNQKTDVDGDKFITVINNIKKGWELDDYLNQGIENDLQPYKKLSQQIKNFKFGKINSWFSLLTVGTDVKQKEIAADFENLKFNPTEEQWNNAVFVLNEILSLKKFFEYVDNHYFITAFLRIYNNKDRTGFNLETFKKKFQNRAGTLVKRADADGYVDMMQSVYWYNMKFEDKRVLA